MRWILISISYKAKRVAEEHQKEIEHTSKWIIRKSVAAGKMPLSYDEMYENMDSEMQKEIDEEILPSLFVLINRWLADVTGRELWKKRTSSSGIILGGFGKNDVYPSTVELSTGSRIRGTGDIAISVDGKNVIDPRSSWPQRNEDGIWTSFAFLESFAQNEFIVRVTTMDCNHTLCPEMLIPL